MAQASWVDEHLEIERVEAPMRKELVEEFYALWRQVFPPDDEDFRDSYFGTEIEHNRDLMYIGRVEGKLGGTVHLVIGKSDPSLGGVGGVATDPEFRRKGIATRLCERARDDIQEWGGEALFLGAGPESARVYRRCGWRVLAGTNVMAWIASRRSPEAYLVAHFEEKRPFTIVNGSAAERYPMVPLIVTPHDWQVMDANVNIFSTRYAIQNSCGGLYQRYEGLLADARGAWFAARTDQARVVGLATARLDESQGCLIDGFVHRNFGEAWEPLIEKTIEWAKARGAGKCRVRASVEDEEKVALFEALGFRKGGVGEEFQLRECCVKSVFLEKGL